MNQMFDASSLRTDDTDAFCCPPVLPEGGALTAATSTQIWKELCHDLPTCVRTCILICGEPETPAGFAFWLPSTLYPTCHNIIHALALLSSLGAEALTSPNRSSPSDLQHSKMRRRGLDQCALVFFCLKVLLLLDKRKERQGAKDLFTTTRSPGENQLNPRGNPFPLLSK